MKELLNNALEQLKHANVTIGKQTYRKQVSLFDVEDLPDIEFNGCKSLSIYQEKIYGSYNQCKWKADELLNNSLNNPDTIKENLIYIVLKSKNFGNDISLRIMRKSCFKEFIYIVPLPGSFYTTMR